MAEKITTDEFIMKTTTDEFIVLQKANLEKFRRCHAKGIIRFNWPFSQQSPKEWKEHYDEWLETYINWLKECGAE